MTRRLLLSLLLPTVLVGIVGCSAGSDTSVNNSTGSSIETGDTNIVWTDTLGRITFDGDSTDWQPRLDYESDNEVGIKPYFPNPTVGKGGIIFRVHKTTYIEIKIDTLILTSQYHSAGLYNWGIPLTNFAKGIHHLTLRSGPSQDSLVHISHGEIRKQ